MRLIQGKVWGETRPLFAQNNVELHHISIDAGAHCSKHMHEHKYNQFYVLDGRLSVQVWKNDYSLIDETILDGGESTVVAPGEYHQFKALADTEALEWYWVELDARDIQRDTVGGVQDSNGT